MERTIQAVVMPGPEIRVTGEAELIESFIAKAHALDDEGLRILAEARRALDETFHHGARRAALEALSGRTSAYATAWIRIGDAYLPRRLEELVQLGSLADPDEAAAWQQVARLARLAIDDALLGLLTADTIPPPHRRELLRSWQALPPAN